MTLKVFSKRNGSVISALSPTATAFSAADLGICSLYHLKYQQTLWFTTTLICNASMWLTPKDRRSFSLIVSLAEELGKEKAIDQKFSDTCLSSILPGFHNLSCAIPKFDKKRALKKCHGRRDSTRAEGGKIKIKCHYVVSGEVGIESQVGLFCKVTV